MTLIFVPTPWESPRTPVRTSRVSPGTNLVRQVVVARDLQYRHVWCENVVVEPRNSLLNEPVEYPDRVRRSALSCTRGEGSGCAAGSV